MTTNPDGGNGHQSAPRWHRLHRARAWLSRQIKQAWTNLPPVWRYETARHTAFSAAVALFIAWLLSQLTPHLPAWAASADGMRATIDHPVRHYIATHTHALPMTAAATYSVWKAFGFVSFVLGFFHNGSARFLWTVWGSATVIMVWIGTPAPGRQVAAGVALLAWVALSGLALRGLRLPSSAFVHVDVHNEAPPAPAVQVRAEIRMPRTEPPRYLPVVMPYVPPSLN